VPVSRCVSTLISGSAFNYSIRERIPAGGRGTTQPLARSPPTRADSNASRRRCWMENLRLQLKLSRRTRRKYRRTEKCPRPMGPCARDGRQLVTGLGLRNLSLLAATSKAMLYSARTWRDPRRRL